MVVNKLVNVDASSGVNVSSPVEPPLTPAAIGPILADTCYAKYTSPNAVQPAG